MRECVIDCKIAHSVRRFAFKRGIGALNVQSYTFSEGLREGGDAAV